MPSAPEIGRTAEGALEEWTELPGERGQGRLGGAREVAEVGKGSAKDRPAAGGSPDEAQARMGAAEGTKHLRREPREQERGAVERRREPGGLRGGEAQAEQLLAGVRRVGKLKEADQRSGPVG